MDSSIGNLILKMSKIISRLSDRITKLEQDSHPPRDFVTCEDCKNNIREKNGKKKT